MENTITFNSILLNDNTKNICTCLFISIFIIFLFMITPLRTFFATSFLMKIIALMILVYTIHLNVIQTNSLKIASSFDTTQDVKSQLNVNIFCSYIFSILLIFLIFFIVRSFF